MHPTLLELGPIELFGRSLGPLTLHNYGLMIAIGFLAAVFFILRDAEKEGLDRQLIAEKSLWALFWGVAGTRLLHIMMFPESYSWKDPIGWVAVWNGGLVFQGAFPLSIAYAWWVLRKHKQPFWKVSDIVLTYMPLAQAFGRIGCFFNGCCFGHRAQDLPWALSFPKGSPPYYAHLKRFSELTTDAQWSFPIHPTQIYSSMLLVLICLTLWLLRKKWQPFTGFVLPMYLMLYSVARFIIEIYRDDDNPTNLGFGVISNQQVFCLAMFALGAGLFIYLRKRSRATESREAAGDA